MNNRVGNFGVRVWSAATPPGTGDNWPDSACVIHIKPGTFPMHKRPASYSSCRLVHIRPALNNHNEEQLSAS